MIRTRVEKHAPWCHVWRSSNGFIVSTMSLAIFTGKWPPLQYHCIVEIELLLMNTILSDELLFAFMLPLLPTVLEQRIGLDPSLTQRFTSIFLAEGAFISVISSPIFGSIADAISSKKTLLLLLLVLTLISTACLSLTTHRTSFFDLCRRCACTDNFPSDMAVCRALLPMPNKQRNMDRGNVHHG